jgi:hypothetical protein
MTEAESRISSGSAGGARAGSSRDDQGLGAHLHDLLALTVGYAKQETVVPLRNLGRYIAWGVAGAVLFATGGAMLTLTAVRVVQSETGRHLHGDLTWVPYLAGVVVASGGVGWALTRILRGDRALRGTGS